MHRKRCAIVIIGASGDLARRKLIPALHEIYQKNQLEPGCFIVGTGRTPFTDQQFRQRFEIGREFADRLFYHTGLPGLRDYLLSKGDISRVIFFFALPPAVYAKTARQLSEMGFGEEAELIIEKPFGYDYESARQLDQQLHRYFDESKIFRIDHYLAKEAVQNILVFRFANSIFYPIWNSRYVESIQISAFEQIGVEERAAYFDSAGIIRDMVQNHLIQLLCLLTMEAPVTLSAQDIRSQKINVLKALEVRQACKYQYAGYREEKGVDPSSNTETFAQLELAINNFRWTGTPVYIRTGKAMNRKGTEIGIRFKELPRLLFNEKGNLPSNKIIFKIQPAEGIILDLSSKTPGNAIQITNTNMAFCYRDSFGQVIPEAYQKLLQDALCGDRTLFVSAFENELSWKKLEHVLKNDRVRFYNKGEVPDPCWGVDWIDFERYGSICA